MLAVNGDAGASGADAAAAAACGPGSAGGVVWASAATSARASVAPTAYDFFFMQRTPDAWWDIRVRFRTMRASARGRADAPLWRSLRGKCMLVGTTPMQATRRGAPERVARAAPG